VGLEGGGGGGAWTDWSDLGQGQEAGTCKCSNEPSCSKKCGEFLD